MSRYEAWLHTRNRALTRVKPVVWRALSDEFARESTELARVAAGSDRNAVSEQFKKVAEGCKSRHAKHRQTD